MRAQGVKAVGAVDIDALSRAWRERAAEQRWEAELRRQDALRLAEGFRRPDAYWRMLSELWALTSPFPPSVVLAEDAQPGLLARVREKGVELP